MALPPAPDSDPGHFDAYQNYEVESEHRDELRAYLEQHGVRTIIQWAGTPVHRFEALGFADVRLPATERFFERCLLLPMNTALSDADVDTICNLIRAFHGRAA
jgi:dTDP-4-amino-4,6-dideoxygalactose transaminase